MKKNRIIIENGFSDLDNRKNIVLSVVIITGDLGDKGWIIIDGNNIIPFINTYRADKVNDTKIVSHIQISNIDALELEGVRLPDLYGGNYLFVNCG